MNLLICGLAIWVGPFEKRDEILECSYFVLDYFLVTMSWWNDLWLNEGFASFMQYKSADGVFPGWSLVNKFNYSFFLRSGFYQPIDIQRP